MAATQVDTEGLRALIDDTAAANVRLARDFVAHREVDIIERSRVRVVARVGVGNERGQRRTVHLLRDDDAWAWSCTCSNRLTHPCKHIAAVAIYVT
jgi:uncharacterized Zn finger protein